MHIHYTHHLKIITNNNLYNKIIIKIIKKYLFIYLITIITLLY